MNDIKSTHFCSRCRRETAHRQLGIRPDSVVVECLGCLSVFARRLSARIRNVTRFQRR